MTGGRKRSRKYCPGSSSPLCREHTNRDDIRGKPLDLCIPFFLFLSQIVGVSSVPENTDGYARILKTLSDADITDKESQSHSIDRPGDPACYAKTATITIYFRRSEGTIADPATGSLSERDARRGAKTGNRQAPERKKIPAL